MRFLISFILLIFSFFSVANAQIASEVPLKNPELVEPSKRPKGNVIPEEETKEVEPEIAEKSSVNEMTLERLIEIVKAIDENAQVRGSSMRLTIAGLKVTIVSDPKNNRMRAFVPIQTLDGVNQQLLYRMLQANFDSTLDARYSIAQEHIISVFIHPLKELDKKQLIEGLGQVVNLVKTYGTAFTSGGMTFGGGDSRNLHRKLIDELLKKGEQI